MLIIIDIFYQKATIIHNRFDFYRLYPRQGAGSQKFSIAPPAVETKVEFVQNAHFVEHRHGVASPDYRFRLWNWRWRAIIFVPLSKSPSSMLPIRSAP